MINVIHAISFFCAGLAIGISGTTLYLSVGRKR